MIDFDKLGVEGLENEIFPTPRTESHLTYRKTTKRLGNLMDTSSQESFGFEKRVNQYVLFRGREFAFKNM